MIAVLQQPEMEASSGDGSMDQAAGAATGGTDSAAGTAVQAAAEVRPSNVLVLGGTQFMGRLMVEHLLANGHRVTMSNRGVTVNPFGECELGSRRP